MPIRNKVIDKDTGWKAWTERIKTLNAPYVKVGVLADTSKGARPHGTLTTAELATVMEFGTEDGRIPARPFLRSTFDEKRDDMREIAGNCLKKILEGTMTTKVALNLMGMRLANDVKNKITMSPLPGILPANKPGYAAEKLVQGKSKKTYGLEKGSWWLGEKSRAYDKKTGADVDASQLVRTLVDTGRMLAAITWKVIIGSGETPAEQ